MRSADLSSLVADAGGDEGDGIRMVVQHQLRTPLTTILGHAELLSDRAAGLPPEVVRSIEAIDNAARRLNGLVEIISELIEPAERSADRPRRP